MDKQTMNKISKENKTTYNKVFKALEERTSKQLEEALEEEKTLSGAMKRLKSLHYSKDNSFKMKASQLAVISNNALDVMIENFGKKEREKWERADIVKIAITVGGFTRKIKMTGDADKDKEKLEDKIADMKADFAKHILADTGHEIPVDDMKHSTDREEYNAERTFSLRQVLRVLNRVHAQYKAFRIDGMKSNNIVDVRACNGIFEAVKEVA